MKHTISFLVGAAFMLLLGAVIPDKRTMTAKLHWVCETNWMVMQSTPQHQRPPEINEIVHTEVGAVTSNLFAVLPPWVTRAGQTNQHPPILLEPILVRKIIRSFQLETQKRYLEEVK